MSLPVLVLRSSDDAAAYARTVQSLVRQSVMVTVRESHRTITPDDGEYLVLTLEGTVLDVTACERAVWFLATRAEVLCVTGAISGAERATTHLASAQQFLVIRAAVAQRLLASADTLDAATAIALTIGTRSESRRGAAWLSEPVIREQADARTLATIRANAHAAMQHLGFDEASLIDMEPGSVPLSPQQCLMSVQPPALTARVHPARGTRVLAMLQGFPMGGYTAFNADLLPRLAAEGHAITTCTTEWWRTDWRLEQVRAVAPDIHHAHATVPPAAIPAYVDWLITSRQIEVVLLSHSHLGFHMLPYLRARHPDVAFVDYVHTDWFEQGMYGSYAAMAARWESQLDAQLATSCALTAQLEERGCDARAVRAAHIGIDTTVWRHDGARLADVRASLGARTETLVLLFSGRLSPEKRPHLAVDVAAELMRAGHDVVLLFAGSGPLIQSTHDRAMAHGLGERCMLLGELDEHTLRHLYAASDVFIAPSEIEGIARSLYEAMAMGCVPVVSDVGGQRELVVPGTGSLVDASRDDAAPYVAAVLPWFDRSARATASAAARTHVVAHFDSARTVRIVCETFAFARGRRRERQSVLPPAMAEELAVLSIDIIRRHVLRAQGR